MRGRPLRGEYGEHAERDIARVEGDDAIEALLKQQGEFESFLTGLDESRIASHRYAPGKWTVKEVIGHMLDDERIFAYRMLCIARGDELHHISILRTRYLHDSNDSFDA
jgi:hypothetical protein